MSIFNIAISTPSFVSSGNFFKNTLTNETASTSYDMYQVWLGTRELKDINQKDPLLTLLIVTCIKAFGVLRNRFSNPTNCPMKSKLLDVINVKYPDWETNKYNLTIPFTADSFSLTTTAIFNSNIKLDNSKAPRNNYLIAGCDLYFCATLAIALYLSLFPVEDDGKNYTMFFPDSICRPEQHYQRIHYLNQYFSSRSIQKNEHVEHLNPFSTAFNLSVFNATGFDTNMSNPKIHTIKGSIPSIYISTINAPVEGCGYFKINFNMGTATVE